MKYWYYSKIIETENPKDLEDILKTEFPKLAGHRNRIVFSRTDCFSSYKEALANYVYGASGLTAPKKEVKVPEGKRLQRIYNISDKRIEYILKDIDRLGVDSYSEFMDVTIS